MYVLDANLYIGAQRDATLRSALRGFMIRESRNVYVSRVVLYELMKGAPTVNDQRRVMRDLGAPFGEHRRVIETDGQVWEDAAFLYRAIHAKKKHAVVLAQASFRNDLLLAASCLRVGATLVTLNRRDFAIIDAVRSFRFLDYLPE